MQRIVRFFCELKRLKWYIIINNFSSLSNLCLARGILESILSYKFMPKFYDTDIVHTAGMLETTTGDGAKLRN